LALQVANDILASASSEIKGTKEVKTGQHYLTKKNKGQKVTCFSKKQLLPAFISLNETCEREKSF